MLTTCIDVQNWTPERVHSWLTGLSDDNSWLRREFIIANDIHGRELILMTSQDLEKLGAKKVSLQESILGSMDKLKSYNFTVSQETVQKLVLKLCCLARSLHKQLLYESSKTPQMTNGINKTMNLSPGLKETPLETKQRVSLETLTGISNIVTTVKDITDAMSHSSFSKHNDLRSMKSLILALSIELTSTAQRDQFVEKPNDILERSARALADYCDRIVHGVTDPLLIQPFYFETIRFKKERNNDELGFVIKTLPSNDVHVIDKVIAPPLASKASKLTRGDEVVQINDQNIVGWTSARVKSLISQLNGSSDVFLVIKKHPRDTNL